MTEQEKILETMARAIYDLADYNNMMESSEYAKVALTALADAGYVVVPKPTIPAFLAKAPPPPRAV